MCRVPLGPALQLPCSAGLKRIPHLRAVYRDRPVRGAHRHHRLRRGQLRRVQCSGRDCLRFERLRRSRSQLQRCRCWLGRCLPALHQQPRASLAPHACRNASTSRRSTGRFSVSASSAYRRGRRARWPAHRSSLQSRFLIPRASRQTSVTAASPRVRLTRVRRDDLHGRRHLRCDRHRRWALPHARRCWNAVHHAVLGSRGL